MATVGALSFASSSAAYAERVHSYAYVTNVDTYQNPSGSSYCRIYALLPRKVLDRAPSGRSPELLKGATEVEDHLTDNLDSQCDEIRHTWIPATFDSDHRSAADLEFPPPHGLWSDIEAVIGAVMVVGLVWLAWKNWKQKRAAARGSSTTS